MDQSHHFHSPARVSYHDDAQLHANDGELVFTKHNYFITNVSNDHPYDVNFFEYPSASPSHLPSPNPTPNPSVYPSHSPTQSPSLSPTPEPKTSGTTSSTSYRSCVDEDISELESSEATRSDIISFDYEIVTAAAADDVNVIDSIVDELERSLLNDVADSVLTCDDRRNLQMRKRRLAAASDLLALDSNPEDVIDEDGVCSTDITLPNFGDCHRIIGSMTAITCSNCPTQEAEILSVIQDGMQNNRYISDDILQVIFIPSGGDTDSSNTSSKDDTSSELQGATEEAESTSSNSISNISIVIGASVALIALVIVNNFLLRRRRRGRKSEMENEDEVVVDDDDEIEKADSSGISPNQSGETTVEEEYLYESFDESQ